METTERPSGRTTILMAIWPQTRRKLRMRAAEMGIPMTELVDRLSTVDIAQCNATVTDGNAQPLQCNTEALP